MEITIGMQNTSREIVLESTLSTDEAADHIKKSLTSSFLELEDTKGRRIVVPSNAVAFVEIGSETTRPVGFGRS